MWSGYFNPAKPWGALMDRPNATQPLPYAFSHCSNFKRKTQSLLNRLLCHPKPSNLFPSEAFQGIKKGLEALPRWFQASSVSRNICITDKEKEALEKKTSETRVCGYYIGHKNTFRVLTFKWCSPVGCTACGADWQGNQNNHSGEWALKLAAPNSIG